MCVVFTLPESKEILGVLEVKDTGIGISNVENRRNCSRSYFRGSKRSLISKVTGSWHRAHAGTTNWLRLHGGEDTGTECWNIRELLCTDNFSERGGTISVNAFRLSSARETTERNGWMTIAVAGHTPGNAGSGDIPDQRCLASAF